MIKVSVIVPIYGVERYIERSVRSLFEQTLSGIEYIFVNDCTPDNSMVILNNLIEEYKERLIKEDKVYKIINLPQNGGLPQARWHGIVEASGEYIVHCDSDDWVDRDMYKMQYEKAVHDNSDMVVCDYYATNGTKHRHLKAFKDNLSKERIYELMFDRKLPWMVWNKMIRTEIYKTSNITVPRQTQGEDMAFILQLLYFVNRISYIPKPLYYYQVGTQTVTHSTDEKAILKRYNAAVDNTRIVASFFENKNNSIYANGVLCIKLTCRNFLNPLLKDNHYYDMWLNTFPEIDSQILNNRAISLKRRFKYFLIKHRICINCFR